MGFELGFGKKKEEKKLTKEEELRKEARKKETVAELRQKHVSELTDEQIVEIGLKTHTKTDKICVLLTVFMIFMIFVPLLFEKIFYDPDLAITERETIYLKLECRKRKSKGTYSLSEAIISEYRDAEVLNVKVQFLYTNIRGSSTITPPQEVQKYNDISVKEFEKVELESNKGYEFFMDFEKNPSLKSAIELKEHTYAAPTQITNMTSLGYQCTQKSKYAIRVYKDGKLVEEKFLEK